VKILADVIQLPAGTDGDPEVIPPTDGGAGSGARPDDDVLHTIAAVTATLPMAKLFTALASHLCDATHTRYGLLAEIAGDGRARTLAFRTPQGFAEVAERDVTGTAWEELVDGEPRHHPSGVRETFPRDALLAERGIECHLGAALAAPDGKILGAPHAADNSRSFGSSRRGRRRNSRGYASSAPSEKARSASAICSTKPPSRTCTRISSHASFAPTARRSGFSA
jgi:hypothetical protein